MRVFLLTSVLLLGSAFSLPSSLAQDKKHDHGPAGHKHTHPTPQYGGVLEDVGEYHVEMVIKDGRITIYLRDHDAKDAATAGFKASVLLTAGSQRVGPVELAPTENNMMVGALTVAPPAATAILTLTDKGGSAAQGRFKLK